MTYVAFFVLLSGFSRSVNEAWVPQPKTNVWVTLTKTINQSTLWNGSLGLVVYIQTCLVGIPLMKDEWNKLHNQTVACDCAAPGKRRWSWWCLWSWQPNAGQSVGWCLGNVNTGMRKVTNFPALSLQPQELGVLGSIKAPVCFYLNYTNDPSTDNTGVNTRGTGIYCNACCNLTTPSQVTTGTNAITLPDNIFLICGNRSWKGIPGKAVGGPCTFVRLTMFHPSLEALTDWTVWYRQNTCDAKSFGPDCNSEVKFWNHAKSSLVALVDTAHALNIIN